jgi:hypothetical protein
MLAIVRCRILLTSSLLTRNLSIKIYRTVILPVVFYGCETWSLILREERRLRMFENMVFENRVFENRVFQNRVYENRVFAGNIWAEEGRSSRRVKKTT